MTVSEGLVVFCNGRRGRCKARFETSSGYAQEALSMATAQGWHAPDVLSLHYCPECAVRTFGAPDAGLDIILQEPPTMPEPDIAELYSMTIDQDVAAALDLLERALHDGGYYRA